MNGESREERQEGSGVKEGEGRREGRLLQVVDTGEGRPAAAAAASALTCPCPSLSWGMKPFLQHTQEAVQTTPGSGEGTADEAATRLLMT